MDLAAQPTAMHPDPAEVARAFYRALASDDFDAMTALYAPDVEFRDMVFAYQDRAGTMQMWRRLRAMAPRPAKIGYTPGRVEGEVAHGSWTADYKVGLRPVHNELTCALTVRGGRIVRHHDSSDWARWAAQAFPLGRLLGGARARAVISWAIRAVVNR